MTPTRAFARVVRVEGARVELAFEVDVDRWGFFRLPPQHPSLLEKYQYHGTIAALEAMERLKPGVRSALTRFEWTCPPLDPAAGHGTRAICEGVETQTTLGFTFDLDTADGQRVVTCAGSGVLFANRDFDAWRAQSKAKARAAYAERGGRPPAPLADAAAVHALVGAPSYVTPFDGATQSVQAYVPAATSFMPHHPYHTGSGDHVNAGQLFDSALQAAHLALDAARPLHCAGGRAQFARYVELDVPFDIRLTARTNDGDVHRLTFVISQLDRDNGTLELHVR